MNIAFAMVSLTIVFLINFIYRKNKSIPRNSSIIFRKMVNLFCVIEIVDLFCCFVGMYLDSSGRLYVSTDIFTIAYSIAVHIYLSLIILLACLSFKYAFALAFFKNISLSAFEFTLVAFAFLLPVEFYKIKSEILFCGPSAIYLYIVCFLILAGTGAIVIAKRENIERKQKEAFMIWAVFWISAAILSVLLPYCCYIGISCAFGLLVSFIFVENPENMQGKHKNTMLFYYIKDCLDYFAVFKEPVNVVGIHFNNEMEILHFLKTMAPQQKFFFLFEDDNNNFYVCFKSNQLLHLLLKDYVSSYGLFAMHFSEIVPDDAGNVADFVKENIFLSEKGFLKTITKEEFYRKEEELKTKEEIELALQEGRIIAYVQPIYDVKKKKFTCGECLCRMKRKGGEIMMPYRFIGIAEKYGLICDIETEMFKNMCQILQQKDELGLESLEANLSIKKGESKHLYEEYVEIMEKYGIDGKYISLEITETDVMEEKNALLGNMNNLKSIGVKFALDDFGTGESNLGYVIDMPIDVMKFDRNIFQKATREIKARLVVENTIEIAHKLGMSVIVEGVETEEDFEICKDMNADFVQGYYFSRPISYEEFVLFCKEKNFKKEEVQNQ